jgi:hypothetical protein
MYESYIWSTNMQLICIYALTVKICIYMHYKSWQNELLLCNSFVPKFSDRYTEPAEYAVYAKLKARLMTNAKAILALIIDRVLNLNPFKTNIICINFCIKTKTSLIQFFIENFPLN